MKRLAIKILLNCLKRLEPNLVTYDLREVSSKKMKDVKERVMGSSFESRKIDYLLKSLARDE